MRVLHRFFGLFVLSVCGIQGAYAQSWKADMSWYDPSKTYIKLYFASSTVAEVNVSALLPHGFPEGTVDPSLVHVYEKGREIPIEIHQNTSGMLKTGDRLRWVTRRQSGNDEKWAYHLETNPFLSGGGRSMYTDTVVYWLTWNAQPGVRYQNLSNPGEAPFHAGFRDTLYLEKDSTRLEDNVTVANTWSGTGNNADLSSYSDDEGSYWRHFDLTNRIELFQNIETIPLSSLIWRERDSAITFQARFQGLSAGGSTAAKRVYIDVVRDLPDGSGAGFAAVGSVEWTTASTRLVSGTLPPTVLRDTSKLQVRFRVENRSVNRAGVNLLYSDWLKFSYYRGFRFNSNLIRFNYRLRYQPGRSVQISKFIPTDTLRVYVPETGVVIYPVANPADSTFSYRYDPENTGAIQHIVVRNRGFSQPVRIARHTFRNSLTDPTSEGEFLIITRPLFRDVAQRYANYRAQKSGLTAMVVEMEDIWELFDHGTRRPIALKRFLHYTFSRWNKPPRYVFIVGDASLPAYNQVIDAVSVPSFGDPPSDDWFVQNWGGPGDYRPQMAVGRLTALTTTELRKYESKVRSYEEQVESSAWKKRVVLLSGGNSNIERQTLLSSNRSFARIASNSLIGADTILVGKTSNDPLGVAPRQDLKQILDDGIFLLHFFGHSAPNSWDLLTDDPESFGNVGRPNIVLSLGCYSGRFTASSNRIISEQFVFADNASVAYIGGGGAGQTPALQRYGDYFYNTMFTEDLFVLGDVVRRTKRRHFEANQTALIDIALIQNSVLLGDPSLRISLPEKPDYLYTSNAFSIRPDPTNVADSIMRVRVNLQNFGRRPAASVQLKLEQRRPDNSVVEYLLPVRPFNLTSFVEFPVKLRANDAGVHVLKTMIDSDGQMDELSKANNLNERNQQVYSTSADLIYPADKGIHTSRTPRMVVASPTFVNGVTIQLQLDSTNTFATPLRSESVQTEQISLTWQPPVRLDHRKNYWWRARILDTGGLPLTSWRTATFFVDSTQTGTWWFQNTRLFRENDFSLTLKQNAASRFEFNRVQLPVSTESSNHDWGRANFAEFTGSTRMNGVEYGRRVNSLHVLALDGKRGRILLNKQYLMHRGRYSSIEVTETVVNQQMALFVNDINALSDGDYVVARIRHVDQITAGVAVFNNNNMLTALSRIGGFKAGNGVNGQSASQIDGTSGYILFGKKGAKSVNETSEYIIRNDGFLRQDTIFTFNAPGGDMIAVPAGPAKQWKQIKFNTVLENFTSEASVEVYGFRTLNSQPEILLKTDRFTNGDQTVSLAGISARVYPYLQLKLSLADSSRTTTPQLNHWQIAYDPVPEVALDPFRAVIPRDTIQEGGLYQFSIDVNNLAGVTADTVFVDYLDKLNAEDFVLIKTDTLFNLAAAANRRVSLSLPTLGKVGEHQFLVRLRTPIPDQYAYNNLFSTRYLIVPDAEPPRIEVLLDNRPIEPFSSSTGTSEIPLTGIEPVIEIRWRDSNELFLLDDPSLLELRLNGEVIPPDDPRITFTGATTSTNNRAVVFFRPTFSASGDSVHTLEIFARDVAQNIAERLDGYTIKFKVTSEVSIPSLYPYPNPMSQFTWFAFQVLAPNVEAIEKLRITIFTLNGRPVRTIDITGDDRFMAEGGLRIGWNRVRWDGRDQDGDLLANGVYLYRVEFRSGGETIPVNNSRSIEKLAIIR